jgi:dihydropyrimidinase
LEQLQIAPGEDTGDTFYSGTRSAIAGGTTTIIAFANQQRQDESLLPLVKEYHRRASARGTFADYGFHMILTRPTKKILDEELPVLFKDEGISSIKVSTSGVPLVVDAWPTHRQTRADSRSI